MDPAGFKDSSNLYQYCFNNPFKYTDPDGEFAFVLALAIPFGTVITEAFIIDALLVAGAATLIYESSSCIDSLVNNLIGNCNGPRPGYLWDDIGEDIENPQVDGFEWKGSDVPSTGKGNWVNDDSGQKLNPDLDHPPPIGPHWDLFENDRKYRLYPDNSWELVNGRKTII